MDGLFFVLNNHYINRMNKEVLEIGKKWEIVVEIKRRCQNATEEDMRNLSDMVALFNTYMTKHVPRFSPIRKISACSIPSICGQVAGFLKAQGLINNVYDKKLKDTEHVYEF